MLVKTVSTVVTTDALGRTVESIPVYPSEDATADMSGDLTAPIDMVEDDAGVPIRIVAEKRAQNSVGQWMDATIGNGSVLVPTLAIGSEQEIPSGTYLTQRVAGVVGHGQSNMGLGGVGAEVALDRVLSPLIYNIRRTDLTHVWAGAYPLEDSGAGRSEGVDDYATGLCAGSLLHFTQKIGVWEPTLDYGETWGIFQLIVGGTDWFSTPGWNFSTGNLSLELQASLPTLLSNFPNWCPMLFYGAKGEESSGTQTQAAVETAILAEIDGFRTLLGRADLPFIYATLNRDQYAADNPVNLAIRNLPNLRNYVGVIDLEARSNYGVDTATDIVGVADEALLTNGTYADNPVHITAKTHRENVAPRAVKAFKQALDANNLGGAPLAQTVPDAPTLNSAAGFDGYAALNFTQAAGNGNSPVLWHEVRYSTTGGAPWTDYPGWVAASSANGGGKVTGLTNGVQYTMHIRAVNKIGASAWSGAVTVTPAAIDLNAGLIHDLVFSAAGNTVTDAEGGTVTKAGGTVVTDGGVDGFQVGGDAHYMRWTSGAANPASFTFAIKLKITSLPNAPRGLMSEWASDGTTNRFRTQYQAAVTTNSRFYSGVGDSTPSDNSYLTDTAALLNDDRNWIIVVDDTAKTIKLYVDGVLIDTASYTTRTPGDRWAIGYLNHQANSVRGIWKKVRVYDRALSADEIAALHTLFG